MRFERVFWVASARRMAQPWPRRQSIHASPQRVGQGEDA